MPYYGQDIPWMNPQLAYVSPETPATCYIHNPDTFVSSYVIKTSNHLFSSPRELKSDGYMRLSSPRISPTPVTNAEYFERMRSTMKIHLSTDFFLELFQLSMGKFDDPTAPFTDQVVVVMMAQYMFIAVRVPPEIDHL
jgi:hypothetical protein